MRSFVRQSNKRGKICSFNQYYHSKICPDILKIIAEDLNVKRKIYDTIQVFLNFRNEHFKTIENEYENNFND